VSIWKVGTVVDARRQTPSGRSIVLEVPGWPGNLAGQHVDVKLSAPDGYTAVRSYSLASAGTGDRIEIAVDRLPDGEVSPYLVDDVLTDDQLELRGPLGGWFVWREEQTEPVQLIAGGSGVVPLIAMIRRHEDADSPAPFRLLYSVRSPEDAFFDEELTALTQTSGSVAITRHYTRRGPAGWPGVPARLTKATLEAAVIPASESPSVYVCGPTGFVEAVADWLVELGHEPTRVRTERFGGA
jgi:ferredoxin-NADP reductase